MIVTLDHLDGIEKAAEEDWDTLAGGSTFYSSWRWLSMGESALPTDEPGAVPGYVVATDHRGRLSGALPCYEMGGRTNHLYDPTAVFDDVLTGTLAEPESWYPGYLAGGRSGYHSDVLTHPDLCPSDRAEAVWALVDRARATADDAGRPLWFMYLDTATARLVADALGPGSLRVIAKPEMVIPVRWRSFGDYVADLPHSRRASVRSERAVFDRTYPTVTMTSLADVVDQVTPLYANLLAKYGGQDCLARARRYLAQQVKYVGDRSVVWLCVGPTGPVAFSLFYLFGDVLYSRFVGFDYAAATHFEYFNLLFYRPLELAIAEGLSQIHLNTASEEGKLRRGAFPTQLWGVLYRSDGFSDEVRDAARARNRTLLADLARRTPATTCSPVRQGYWLSTA